MSFDLSENLLSDSQFAFFFFHNSYSHPFLVVDIDILY